MSSDELLCHAVGDYLIQSDWMAQNKIKSDGAAALHALSYSLPFLSQKPTPAQFALIAGTHYLIDRYRLARYVCWFKNQLAPNADRTMTPTGYPEQTPIWLSTWLLIIADNTIHVLLNRLILKRRT